jgi:aminobenzoyl-glutamate transport protein
MNPSGFSDPGDVRVSGATDQPPRKNGSRGTRNGGAGLADRALNLVEQTGNRLPDPITLFVVFMALVLGISWLAAALGVSAVHPGTQEEIRAVNLLTAEGIQRILIQMPRTFTDFPPLGLVLVVMIGIGVAERTGLIETALKGFVRSVPRWLVTVAIVFGGLMSSLAVDAGYVVLIPLGAVIFHGMGRHPIAGLAAAFAGVSAGFSSNLILTALDPLLAGFTEPAAQLVDPNYRVDPTANWFLMAALVPVFTIAGTLVTERILEPRLGPYTGGVEVEVDEGLTREERKGLLAAGLTVLATLALVGWWAIPENGVLRGPDGEIAPLLSSIVALMLFVFFLPGLVYGLVTGKIRSDREVASMTSETMSSMGAYIVLAFVAAHFIAFFNWSNLGLILAISGAAGLQSVGFTGLPLIVSFIFVSAFINLFIGSASAKWAIMAPVFVPMLMLLGYSPELTQASYRIGDSFTNVLTPLLPYYPLVIIFAQKYDREVGLGTLISAMLPYSVVFALTAIPMLVLWILFGIPLGPGAPMEYIP